MFRWATRIVAIALVTLSGQAYAADGVDACKQFSNATLATLLSIIDDPVKPFEQKHTELKALFEKTVAIDEVGKTASGEYWTKANENQRSNFLRVYRQYISSYYVNSFNENDLAGISAVNMTKFEPMDPNEYHARLKIDQKNDDPIVVELHLVEAPAGTCRIHDFTAEGVSMRASQTAELQNLGKIGGLKLITQKLSEHISH